jgi:dUTP pyrophosphatase
MFARMKRELTVSVRRVREGNWPLPSYKSAGAAGMDLCAAISDPLTLEPKARGLVPTGIAVAIPRGYEGQVRARSGLALQHGIGLVNAPGTIDSDYRGEIGVLLINHGDDPFTIEPGSRIAQLVVCPVVSVTLELVADLDVTARNDGGYGSTGLD